MKMKSLFTRNQNSGHYRHLSAVLCLVLLKLGKGIGHLPIWTAFGFCHNIRITNKRQTENHYVLLRASSWAGLGSKPMVQIYGKDLDRLRYFSNNG